MVETTSLRSDLEFTTPIFFVQDGLLVRSLHTSHANKTSITQVKPSYSITEFLAQPFQVEVWAVLLVTLLTTIALDLLFRLVIHLARRVSRVEMTHGEFAFVASTQRASRSFNLASHKALIRVAR